MSDKWQKVKRPKKKFIKENAKSKMNKLDQKKKKESVFTIYLYKCKKKWQTYRSLPSHCFVLHFILTLIPSIYCLYMAQYIVTHHSILGFFKEKWSRLYTSGRKLWHWSDRREGNVNFGRIIIRSCINLLSTKCTATVKAVGVFRSKRTWQSPSLFRQIQKCPSPRLIALSMLKRPVWPDKVFSKR